MSATGLDQAGLLHFLSSHHEQNNQPVAVSSASTPSGATYGRPAEFWMTQVPSTEEPDPEEATKAEIVEFFRAKLECHFGKKH